MHLLDTIMSDDCRINDALISSFSNPPKEIEILLDTRGSIRGVPRRASARTFYPVGHISLDTNKLDVKPLGLDLPEHGCYWISTFYVSACLQSQGIGRAAMDMIENIAVELPLCATTIALDTMHKEDQMKEDIAMAYYGRVPKVANQDWYEIRGYKLIKIVPNHYQRQERDGILRETRTVFMKRNLPSHNVERFQRHRSYALAKLENSDLEAGIGRGKIGNGWAEDLTKP